MQTYRPARPEDCETIASHIRGLAWDIGVRIVPKVTADDLRRYAMSDPPLLMLWVAETRNGIVGSCVANVTFSTWRGQPGIHVVDLYVDPTARRGRVGEGLLRAVAKDAWAKGSRFIRLDVDRTNQAAARFYLRAGFKEHLEDTTFAIDASELEAFIAAG